MAEILSFVFLFNFKGYFKKSRIETFLTLPLNMFFEKCVNMRQSAYSETTMKIQR